MGSGRPINTNDKLLNYCVCKWYGSLKQEHDSNVCAQ